MELLSKAIGVLKKQIKRDFQSKEGFQEKLGFMLFQICWNDLQSVKKVFKGQLISE